MFIFKNFKLFYRSNSAKGLGWVKNLIEESYIDIIDIIESLEDSKSNVPGLNDDTSINKGINSNGEKSIYIFNEWMNPDFEGVDEDEELYGEPEYYDILDQMEKDGKSVGKFKSDELIKVLKKWLELQDLNFEFAILFQDKSGIIHLDGVASQSELAVAIEKVEKIEKTSER